MTLENRTIVITGASGGLGFALARSADFNKSNLALIDIDQDKLDAMILKLEHPANRTFAMKVDLLDSSKTRSAVDAVLDKYGRVDILLHVVGGWTGGKNILEAEVQDLNFMINQHIWTSFNVCRAFIPPMIQGGWGRIIMVTSPFASRPIANGGPYSIGKAGQEALVLTLAEELKGTRVTANLLQAKSIDIKRVKLTSPNPENAYWTTPEELVAATLFLLSEEAASINGARIPLYGSY